MRTCLSPEAQKALRSIGQLDRDCAIALEACIGMLAKAEFPSMTVSASGIAELVLSQSSSPASAVLPPGSSLLAQEVKVSIQSQYFAAAERGEISRIRAWRIVRGLDQATLALRAHMTQPEVSRAERLGQAAKMKGETLKRLARALQVGIDDLL